MDWVEVPPRCTARDDGVLGDGSPCERDVGHDGPHWYTMWEYDHELEESVPYPVQWST